MKKERAQITVFLSFILLSMAGLICATLESARLYGMKIQGANSLELGLYSVFGEYNRELLEYYDVFFIDSAYGEEYQPKKLEKRLKDYMSYQFNPIQGIDDETVIDIWQMQVGRCKVTEENCATDSNGIVFRNQAVAYINDKFKSQNRTQTREIIEKAKSLKGFKVKKSFNEVKNMIGEEEMENPLLPIAQLMGKSILSIIKENQNISSKQINMQEAISYRSAQANREGKVELEIKGEKGELLWNAYLLEKFRTYTQQIPKSQKSFKDSVLDYELEYIIFGQNSDIKNLELVLSEIHQIRQEKNMSYLRGSQEKLEEVKFLATLLVGETANPMAVEVVKGAILYAWAYGESLWDVSALIKGDKVAFDKADATWKTQLKDLIILPVVIKQKNVSDDSGLNYIDYIQMISYLNSSSQQNIRSLDLIEQNIVINSDNNIQLNHCVESVQVQCEFQGEPVFLKMPFIKNALKEIYSLKKERGYSY